MKSLTILALDGRELACVYHSPLQSPTRVEVHARSKNRDNVSDATPAQTTVLGRECEPRSLGVLSLYMNLVMDRLR